MILSVSRRTDIPGYYSQWFYNRIKEGFLYVKNPINPHQISKLLLSPEVVDCIVFWTKNPGNMMAGLNQLRDFAYYFQFTLTCYGKDVEPNLPDKGQVLIPTFQRLSGEIGKERVIWRYDPIFLNERYTTEYHIRAFGKIAEQLCGCTQKVIISFVDFYAKTKRNAAHLNMRRPQGEELLRLAGALAHIAGENGMIIETCAEEVELQSLGICHGSCIDRRLIEKLTGYSILGKKDGNQRKACGCLESVDVGTYHTCLNGCKYCYANFSEKKVRENIQLYHPEASLLCGMVGEKDRMTQRMQKSLIDRTHV